MLSIHHVIFCGIGIFLDFSAFGFELLSGPNKSKLGVSIDSPVVEFHWNGSAPNISDAKDVGGEGWAALENTSLMQQLLLYSLDKWNNVPGSYIQLELVVDYQTSVTTADKIHSIVVKKSKNLSSAAFAAPDVEGKLINDCDITVADNAVTAKGLIKTLVHEIGHCLGLGHNHTNYGSIMGYSRDNNSLDLSADDMAGLIYLYRDPRYGSESEIVGPSCGVIASLNPEQNIANIAFYILVLIPLALSLLIPKKRR